jgi:chromosome segregation ATPase
MHSALHKERELELDTLSAVNNKLMHYTFRLRKLDENLHVLDESIFKMKKHHQQDTDHYTMQHSSDDTETKAQIAAAKKRLNALHPAIEKAKRELENEKMLKKSIEDENENLRTRNASAGATARESAMSVLAAEQENMEIEHSISFLEIARESLQQQLDASRRACKDAALKSQDADMQASKCESDYRNQKIQKNGELDALRAQLELCKSKKTELENRLRQEYKDILDSKMSELQESETLRKNSESSERKAKFDREYGELQDKMEEAARAGDKLRQDVVEAELELSSLTSRITLDANLVASVSRRRENASEELTSIKVQHREALEAENRKIAALQEVIEEKDVEYKELLAKKTALDQEILAYRLLLENEEDRVGNEPPQKKVRRSSSQSVPTSSASVADDSAPLASRTRSRQRRNSQEH